MIFDIVNDCLLIRSEGIHVEWFTSQTPQAAFDSRKLPPISGGCNPAEIVLLRQVDLEQYTPLNGDNRSCRAGSQANSQQFVAEERGRAIQAPDWK